MTALLFTFVISGLVLAAVSVPLILGKIPPNGLYGFRVRRTMEHPEIWYPVNAYGAKRTLIASLLYVLAAIGLFYVPGLGADTYSYAVLVVCVAMFTIVIVTTLRFMNTL